MGNNNQGWNWNWNWNWEWDKHSGEHQKSYKKHNRNRRRIWPALIMFCLFGRPLVHLVVSIVRSLARGFSSGISAILSAFGSSFRATSGTALLGGLFVGVIIGLYVYRHKFGRRQDTADEEEEITKEKEPEQIDSVPIPMTLGNTPSSSDEEFVPQIYNTFGN
jgi:hypothetical protein